MPWLGWGFLAPPTPRPPRSHYHERLSCLYDDSLSGHSTQVGAATDDASTPIFGSYEDTDVHPEDLDACGAHFGPTPDSGGADVYHHHVQEKPPFIVGCFGPSDDGGPVTYDECVSYYSGCDQDWYEVTTQDGVTRNYDLWCAAARAVVLASNSAATICEARAVMLSGVPAAVRSSASHAV